MALLSIPEQYEIGFWLLATIEDSTFEELLVALAAARPASTVSGLIKDLASRVEHQDEDDLREVVPALASLYSARAYLSLSNDDVIDAVIDAAADINDEDFEIPDDAIETFRARLARLLDVPVLQVASKAQDVLTLFERTLCKARVVSDIRPIFGNDTEEIPAAAIVHTLKLSYHEGADLKDFYVMMSPKTMAKITHTLERAQRKAERLERVLAAAGIADVEATDTH